MFLMKDSSSYHQRAFSCGGNNRQDCSFLGLILVYRVIIFLSLITCLQSDSLLCVLVFFQQDCGQFYHYLPAKKISNMLEVLQMTTINQLSIKHPPLSREFIQMLEGEEAKIISKRDQQSTHLNLCPSFYPSLPDLFNNFQFQSFRTHAPHTLHMSFDHLANQGTCQTPL